MKVKRTVNICGEIKNLVAEFTYSSITSNVKLVFFFFQIGKLVEVCNRKFMMIMKMMMKFQFLCCVRVLQSKLENHTKKIVV